MFLREKTHTRRVRERALERNQLKRGCGGGANFNEPASVATWRLKRKSSPLEPDTYTATERRGGSLAVQGRQRADDVTV